VLNSIALTSAFHSVRYHHSSKINCRAKC